MFKILASGVMIRLSAIPQQHTKQGQPLLWKEPLF